MWVAGRGADGYPLTVEGSAGTWDGSSQSGHDRPFVTLEHLLIHPGYLVGTFPATLSADYQPLPSVVIWTQFSRDVNPADVSRLMQFDLGCLTSSRSCKERDLMPTVWAQSVEDKNALQQSLSCTPELSERAAQLADVIAIVRPTTVELKPPTNQALPSDLPGLAIVSLIKKPKNPRLRATMEVEIDSPDMAIASDTKEKIQVGKSYIFLVQVHEYSGSDALALYPCGVLTLNAANLAVVQKTEESQREIQ